MVGCAEFAKKLSSTFTTKKTQRLTAAEKILALAEKTPVEHLYQDPWQAEQAQKTNKD